MSQIQFPESSSLAEQETQEIVETRSQSNSISSTTSNDSLMSIKSNNTKSNNNQSNQSLNCRMYENEYPNVDELVVVQVKSIVEMGAYCSLLEYNHIEGMILMSELSRRRIRSVTRLIRVGRQEIVAVLRVNKEKGYIDLSKKRVSPDEVAKVEERWNKSKAVHSIMRHCAKKSKFGVEELYRRFGWPIAKKYGNCYDGFKYYLDNQDKFLNEYKISNKIANILFQNISKRMAPQIVTIRATIECTCFTTEGILAIKRALKAGLQSHSDDDKVIKIKLVKPPLFNVSLSTLSKDQGIKIINDVIKKIEENLTNAGGSVTIRQPAHKLEINES